MTISTNILLDVVGLLTIILSGAGCLITLYHFRFYLGSKSPLAIAIRRIFVTDAVIYASTLLFGVWAFFQLGTINHNPSLELIRVGLYAIRLIAMSFNIAAAVALSKEYKND